MSEAPNVGGAGLFSGISSQPSQGLFGNSVSGSHTLFSKAFTAVSNPSNSLNTEDEPIFSIETDHNPTSYANKRHLNEFYGVHVDLREQESPEHDYASGPDFNDLDGTEQNPNVNLKESNHSPSKTASFWPAVKVSRLPAGLNNKTFLFTQFQQFGQINRIVCQPSLDCAYVAFDSLSAAQRAKRNGRQPVRPSDEGLPSTVLLTMARYRFRSSSSCSVPDSPTSKKKSTSAKSPMFKQSLFSRQDTKPTIKRTATDDTFATKLDSTVQHPIPEHSTAPKSMRLETTPTFVSTTQRDHSSQRAIYASTIEERLNVLQSHYKIERDRQTNRISLAPANQVSASNSEDWLPHQTAPIQGTCPDMCPELERYLRVAHQRVSMFECIPSTLAGNSSDWEMDPTRAVKDYQRSSADQPVPLPCELRPTHVLQRTMAYLLASIADRPELETSRSLWKPWYEFMWTRTRAIRKDVVQQGLCCPIIVGIIERIARFHIFCAARLVDQPIDSFDPRINSENLTQCLQTLKEMYHDLAVDKKFQNESSAAVSLCPCESEFRAYLLLMKLNDQSEFSEAQNLPTHIRQSKPVRFAFAVHEALHTKNFIRFFRLARNASCLNACLMHRYFVQIRGQALSLLSGAFAGHPKREVQYPLSSLTRQLAFENDQEAKHFCESWGLVVMDSFVIFEKQIQPRPPELPWREKRAYQLIEFKRFGTSLSELFNGSPTSPTDATPWPVHCSFDTNGLFTSSFESTPDLVTSTSALPIATTSVQQPQSLFSNFEFRPTSVRPIQSTIQPSHPTSEPSFRLDHATPTQSTQLANTQLLSTIVQEWIAEHLPLVSLVRSIMAEEAVIDQIFSDLVDQLICSEIEQIFKKTLTPLNQLGLELRDNLMDSVLKTEIRDLTENLFISDFLCNDQFNDLLTDLIMDLCQSCHMRAVADAFYRVSLLQLCFSRFHCLVELRQAQLNRQTLLESMPTCVKASIHPLLLSGERANQIWSSLMPAKIDHNKQIKFEAAIKEDRFSSDQTMVDLALTWDPIPTMPNSTHQIIGIYVPELNCPTQFDSFAPIVTNWLIKKLKHFHLIHIPNWPDPALDERLHLTALIYIGSITNLAPNQPNLPLILALTPHSADPVPAKQSLDNFEVSPNLYLIRIACAQNQVYLPNPFWSAMLQHGLTWLQTRPSHDREQLANRIGVNQSTIRGGSNLRGMPSLVDFISAYVDHHFLRPLADLAQGWRARKLVDPPLADLFNAYHSTLSDLFKSIHSVELSNHLNHILTIPKPPLDQFLLIGRTEHDLLNSDWSQLVNQWNLFAQTIKLSMANKNWVDCVLRKIQADFTRSFEWLVNVQPLPILAPWITICFATIRNCLDHLGQVGMANLMNEEEAMLELIRLVPEQSNLDRNHFKLIAEPTLTRQAAYELSIKSHQTHVISTCLTLSLTRPTCITKKSPPRNDTIHTKLNQLLAKTSLLEQSLQETMVELEASTNLTNRNWLSDDR